MRTKAISDCTYQRDGSFGLLLLQYVSNVSTHLKYVRGIYLYDNAHSFRISAFFCIFSVLYVFVFQLDKEIQTKRTVPLVCGR